MRHLFREGCPRWSRIRLPRQPQPSPPKLAIQAKAALAMLKQPMQADHSARQALEEACRALDTLHLATRTQYSAPDPQNPTPRLAPPPIYPATRPITLVHEEDPWAYESGPDYRPRHYNSRNDDEDDWSDRWSDQAFDSYDSPDPYNHYNGHDFVVDDDND